MTTRVVTILSPPIPILTSTRDVERLASMESTATTTCPIVEQRDQRAVVRAIVLETSVAVHSIIIGFGLGSLSRDSVSTIRVLMAALTFHQYFEGVSLGTAVSETKFSQSLSIGLAVVFSCTVPVGVVIGILTERFQDSADGGGVQGFANAIAAGSLIYSCLVEMVAESFMEEALRKLHSLKFFMIVSFTLGVGSMAMLAMWA
jgi:solute carrier family 39 (zinc transporter), member 1/2/3